MGGSELSSADARSRNYIRQLKGSVFYKLGAILATFLAMPIMIKYLGVEQFGIWSTMLTLVTWVMLFDLGIGNGLKNKISESLAEADSIKASSYISTAYGLVGLVSFFLFSLFLILGFFIPWQAVFNTDSVEESVLKEAVTSLAFFIFLNFWISLVSQVYHGLQKSSFVVFGQFISNFFALILVWIFFVFFDSSLVSMVWIFGVSLFSSNAILTLILSRSNPELMPHYKGFDRYKISPLLSLGLKFFIIQLAVLTIFMTDKILITQLLGPEYVTPYEVLFKLFSVITVMHGLVLAPLWPAYSEAYFRDDFEWIKKTLKKQLLIGLSLMLAAVLLTFISPFIIGFWIGQDVKIDHQVNILFCALVCISVWNNIFGNFLGAIGKVRLGSVHTFFSAIFNVPLSIYFVSHLGFGLAGIVLATILSISISSFISPIQSYFFLRSKSNKSILYRVLS